jgi:hypothetical protein
MKFRSFILSIIIAGLILLSLAGVSISQIIKNSPLTLKEGGVTITPTATMFIPQQAPLMVSLLTNPDRLEAFSQLGSPLSQRPKSQQDFTQLKNSLLAQTGLNYNQQIKPWLGEEITFAITSLDLDREPENGSQAGYLLAVTTKNANLAKNFLQSSYSQKALSTSSELNFETYKGVNIIDESSFNNPYDQGFKARAVVGKYVLFANNINVLKNAINNVQAKNLNLANSTAYQSALETITEPRIGIAVVNLPAIAAWIDHQPIPETPDIEQILTVSLGLKPQGLVAQTALIGVSGDTQQKPALNAPVTALALIPSETVLTAAGIDLNHLWEQIETGLDQDSPLQKLFNQAIVTLEKPLEIDLPTTIFSWVKGEYALATVPNKDQLDWIFVAEKRPEFNAQSAIDHLDELAQNEGYSVGNLPLFDGTMKAWTKLETKGKNKRLVSLDAQVKGVHTTIDNYEVFASSIELLSKAVGQQEKSLLNSNKFQDAIAALPLNNDGYFYIDWQNSNSVFQKIPLLKVIRLAGSPLFKNLESLTLSSEGSENGVRRATIFFNLTPHD